MKNIKRMLIECLIIACIFGSVNFAFSIAASKKTLNWSYWTVGFPGDAAVFSSDAAQDLAAIWYEEYLRKYSMIGEARQVVAYNKDTMELNSAWIPIKGIKYPDKKAFDFLATAYTANSVVKSNNNLAERIKKLENRVQDIEKKCCP